MRYEIFKNKKIIFSGVLMLLIVIILTWQVTDFGNGGWTCRDGVWVAKDKPKKPRPLHSCAKQDKQAKETPENAYPKKELASEGKGDEIQIVTQNEPTGDDVRISQLGENDVISSPLVINGSAKDWYFEGSFVVKLLNDNDEILAQGSAQAQDDWMEDNFVPFTVELVFDSKGAEKGRLVFEKSNPSGLPENTKSVSLPVLFK